MTDIDKVKDRVRKLLAVARNHASTEGEIDNALRFARQLMNSYHLEESDLKDDPHTRAAKTEMKDAWAYTKGKRIASWEGSLAVFVRDFVQSIGVYTEVRPEVVRRNGVVEFDEKGQPVEATRIVFFGNAEEVDLATELFSDLQLTIFTMARLKFGTVLRGKGRSYADGFVSGLFTKLRKGIEEDKKDQTTNALIVRSTALAKAKQENALDWLRKTKGIKLKKKQTSQRSWDHDAYREGQNDGRNAEVTAERRKKLGGY